MVRNQYGFLQLHGMMILAFDENSFDFGDRERAFCMTEACERGCKVDGLGVVAHSPDSALSQILG